MIFQGHKTYTCQPLIELSILVTFLLMFVSCSGDGPTGPSGYKDVSYFPLAVGNNWIYGMENSYYGNNFSWTIVKMSGDTALVERPFQDGTQCYPVTVVKEGPDYLIKTGTDTFEPFYRFMPDSNWISRRPYDCDDYLEFKAVIETNTIVTPAGSFKNCLRIERQSTSNCDDAGITVEWWAPGVGMVRWEELNFYAGGPIAGHLLSYHLPDE